MSEQPVSESASTQGKPSKKVLVVAFLTIFLDLLGFGIIIPIQPFYAKSFGASATVVTLLGASYSAMQFFFSPFWGGLSDKLGVVRSFCLASSFRQSVTLCLRASTLDGLGILFAARMLAGLVMRTLGRHRLSSPM